MLRIFYLILFVFTTAINLSAQVKTWQYGTATQQEVGEAIIALPQNQGFLTLESEGNNTRLRKISNTGTLVWEKPFADIHLSTMVAKDSQSVLLAGFKGSQTASKSYVLSVNIFTQTQSLLFEDTDTLNTKITKAYKKGNDFYFTKITYFDASPSKSSLVKILGTALPIDTPLPFIQDSKATAISQNTQGVWVAGIYNGGIFLWKEGAATPVTFPKISLEEEVTFLITATDGSMYIGVKQDDGFGFSSSRIIHTDSNGNLLTINQQPTFSINDAIADGNAGFICTGFENNQLIVRYLKNDFSVKYSKTLSTAPYSEGAAICKTTEGVAVVGQIGSSDANTDLLLLTSSDAAPIKRAIKGNVTLSDICNAPTATPLQNWVITGRTVLNNKTHYAVTDKDGNYTMNVDTSGTIEIKSVAIEGFKQCGIVQDTVLGNGLLKTMPPLHIIDTVNTLASKPRLVVDILTSDLAYDSVATYLVRAQNPTNKNIANVSIELSFPTELQPLIGTGNTLTIAVGTFKKQGDTTFTIKRKLVEPNKSTKKTYCVEARIFPNNSSWLGPRLQIKGECQTDSVKFFIKNEGNAYPSGINNRQYIIIEDDIILRQGNIKNLNNNEIQTLSLPKQGIGGTYAFVVLQGFNNPYGTYAGARVENCGANSGFFPQNTYADQDDDPTRAVQCLSVGVSAASKTQVFPIGIATKKFSITDTTYLEFLSKIVNSSNQTIPNAVVEMKLSKKLKLNSIEFGARSKPYKLAVVSDSILIFTFDNINLKPQSQSPKEAFAYFGFRIKVPVGDTIKNEGQTFTTETAVRFGYVAPLMPIDTISRIIKYAFSTVATFEPVFKVERIEVAPNPFQNETTITVSEAWLGATFDLFNTQGQLILQIPITQTNFKLHASDLPNGLYVARIHKNGKLLATGRVVAQ